MKRGFYTIMSAQFFSSLADNALFVASRPVVAQFAVLRNGSKLHWYPCLRCFTWYWRLL